VSNEKLKTLPDGKGGQTPPVQQQQQQQQQQPEIHFVGAGFARPRKQKETEKITSNFG
jgi:hypothetical protein